jgi:hypothetical protein
MHYLLGLKKKKKKELLVAAISDQGWVASLGLDKK